MPEADQIHTGATQFLKLAVRLPQLPACHRRDEVGQVMPEPVDQATQPLDLLGLGGVVPGENGSRQNAVFIEQNPIRANMHVRELARASKCHAASLWRETCSKS